MPSDRRLPPRAGPGLPWCCPTCRGSLAQDDDTLFCGHCDIQYPLIAGIPDLRDASLVRPEHLEDRKRARQFAQNSAGWSLEEIIASYFTTRDYWTPAMAEQRVRRTLAAPEAMRGEIRGWLAPAIAEIPDAPVPFLDLGCGLGGLLSAAALEGRHGIGIDQSLHLLVGAKRMIEAHGGQAVLAAAFGERLPLANATTAGVTMQDVFEHVDSKAVVLAQVQRVLAPGGTLALCVPNRFSLAAEPHVRVWGVGWLPRRWQRAYVHLRSKDPYTNTVLPSAWEIERLLRRNAPDLTWALDAAPIPEEEIPHFTARRARLARAYNRLLRNSYFRRIQIRFGPSIRVVARRPPGDAIESGP